jgi:hypothetical protein
MEYLTEINLDDKMLIVTVIGELDEATYFMMLNKAFNSLKSINAQHILLDISRATVRASTLEVYKMVTSNIEMIHKRRKYAIVYSGNTIQEEYAKFGETVAYNRGWQMRVFRDVSEARKWLAIF